MSPEDWRKSRNLSQDAIARLLGINGKNPATTWQRWESGKRQPPLTIVVKVETLSDGQVNARSWIDLRQHSPMAAA